MTDENKGSEITAYHITTRDMKKATKMRAQLARLAPPGSTLGRIPIRIMPRMRKNRMIAVDADGNHHFEINLKTSAIKALYNPEMYANDAV